MHNKNASGGITASPAEASAPATYADYRAMFENAVEGMFRTSPDGKFLEGNAAMAAILGYRSPADLMGSVHNITAQVYAQPGRREEVLAMLKRDGRFKDQESEIIRGDGSHAWVSESAWEVYNTDGKLLYYAGSIVDITAHKLAGQLQGALYDIADLTSSALERPEMLRQIHRIVSKLMYAENFFIVLYDSNHKTLRFAYFADLKDSDVFGPNTDIHEADLANTLTVALLHLGKPLMGSSAELRARLNIQPDEHQGPDSEAWLGVPMLAGGEVRGAIVVQSYDKLARYNEQDQTLLAYVAEHVLAALMRLQVQEELEHRVQLRTQELALANRKLVEEVSERAAGERLQAALFRIAELSSTSANMKDFYAAVHAEIDKLLYARNFFVAVLSEDSSVFHYPYAADELDNEVGRMPRKLSRGLTEYVLRTGKPLLASPQLVEEC